MTGKSVGEIRQLLMENNFKHFGEYKIGQEGATHTWQGSGVENWIHRETGMVYRIDTLGNPTGNIRFKGTEPHIHLEAFYTPADLITEVKNVEIPKWDGTRWSTMGEAQHLAQSQGQNIFQAKDDWVDITHFNIQSPNFTQAHRDFNSQYNFLQAQDLAERFHFWWWLKLTGVKINVMLRPPPKHLAAGVKSSLRWILRGAQNDSISQNLPLPHLSLPEMMNHALGHQP